jgi:hypothetical protein
VRTIIFSRACLDKQRIPVYGWDGGLVIPLACDMMRGFNRWKAARNWL